MISGMVINSRPNIGFNSRRDGNRMRGKHRSNDNIRRSDKMYEDLIKSGIIEQIKYGAKYCFNVGRLTDSEKIAFNEFVLYFKSDSDEDKKKALKQNWWTIEIDELTEDKFSFMEKACEFYQNIEGAAEKCRFNVYGTVKIPVKFSSVKLVKSDESDESNESNESTGLIKYPYGAMFFGDSKNDRDMIDAHVACVGSCAEELKKENNHYFTPIEESDFTVNGIVKTNGRLLIYYVESEEIAYDESSDSEKFYPAVKCIELLFSAVRNKSETYRKGFVERIYISRVEDREPTAVESVADYVLTVGFAKNETQLNKDVILHNAADYIWMIGENYEDYCINEEGFVSRRADLGLEATQTFIGEEYRKRSNENKKPKKFVKTEPNIKVAVDEDLSESVTIEPSNDDASEVVKDSIENDDTNDWEDVDEDESDSDSEPFEIG